MADWCGTPQVSMGLQRRAARLEEVPEPKPVDLVQAKARVAHEDACNEVTLRVHTASGIVAEVMPQGGEQRGYVHARAVREAITKGRPPVSLYVTDLGVAARHRLGTFVGDLFANSVTPQHRRTGRDLSLPQVQALELSAAIGAMVSVDGDSPAQLQVWAKWKTGELAVVAAGTAGAEVLSATASPMDLVLLTATRGEGGFEVTITPHRKHPVAWATSKAIRRVAARLEKAARG